MPVSNPSISACTAHNVNPAATDCGRDPESAANLFSNPQQTQCSIFLDSASPVEMQQFRGLKADEIEKAGSIWNGAVIGVPACLTASEVLCGYKPNHLPITERETNRSSCKALKLAHF